MSSDLPAPCLDLCRSSVSSKDSRRMHAISMITMAVSPMTIPQYGHDISHPLAPGGASPLCGCQHWPIPWEYIRRLCIVRLPCGRQLASDRLCTNVGRYAERARLVRRLHRAGPDRWNCAPRRTIITTSKTRRSRSHRSTLRLEEYTGQGGEWGRLRHRRVFVNTVEWSASFPSLITLHV